jgi:dTDP-4-dehydro-6-deoxy-alpha-D-glucopyranose 2,3-dehydratase
MNTKEHEFLKSALTEENPYLSTSDFFDWYKTRKKAHQYQIKEIPFSKLLEWSFDKQTGNISHSSGKFFSIEGVHVRTNAGPVEEWEQPIINQPEIGILGFLTKKINGILYFLMQAKMEPGNINNIQMAPTVQATKSNFTRVHKGTFAPYLEYFLDKSKSRILLDALQSEQGARFLRKRNRNIILETDENIQVLDDYCWLTLAQIHKLMRTDNIVNMDARTVLSSISFCSSEAISPIPNDEDGLDSLLGRICPDSKNKISLFGAEFLKSALDTENPLHDSDEIISWFTEMKTNFELEVDKIPLKQVNGWKQNEFSIFHKNHRFFSVIAVDVIADNREVKSWTQPMVKPNEPGIVAFITKNINGVLHFLIQAKVEPGNFDIIEMSPTVQCVTGSYKEDAPGERPLFLEYVLNADKGQIKFSSMQSEEGGRFFHEENQNIIVEVGEDFSLEVPENYIWMTMNQLKIFIKYNNFVNVEARCLLATLGFLE